MQTDWADLVLFLFPIISHNWANEDLLIWRLAVAGLRRASITFLALDEDRGEWNIPPRLVHWMAATAGDMRQ